MIRLATSSQDTGDDNEDATVSIRLDAENLFRIAGQSLQGILSGSDNGTCDQSTQTADTVSVASVDDDEPCDVPDLQIHRVGARYRNGMWSQTTQRRGCTSLSSPAMRLQGLW